MTSGSQSKPSYGTWSWAGWQPGTGRLQHPGLARCILSLRRLTCTLPVTWCIRARLMSNQLSPRGVLPPHIRDGTEGTAVRERCWHAGQAMLHLADVFAIGYKMAETQMVGSAAYRTALATGGHGPPVRTKLRAAGVPAVQVRRHRRCRSHAPHSQRRRRRYPRLFMAAGGDLRAFYQQSPISVAAFVRECHDTCDSIFLNTIGLHVGWPPAGLVYVERAGRSCAEVLAKPRRGTMFSAFNPCGANLHVHISTGESCRCLAPATDPLRAILVQL